MAINQRSKGNKNERTAAKVIEKWTNKTFSRTPSSGGLRWKSSMSKGDIVCTTEGHYFPFCIEVKAYEKVDFSELLRPNKKISLIEKFWNQNLVDSKACNKKPMLMIRYNGLPNSYFFIVIPIEIIEIFPNPQEFLVYPPKGLAIIGSDSLLKVDYKKIRKTIKAYNYEYPI